MKLKNDQKYYKVIAYICDLPSAESSFRSFQKSYRYPLHIMINFLHIEFDILSFSPITC